LDSITHIVAGAALGELAFGKKIGNKALIVGAIANTIPDIDVFFVRLAPTADAALRVHRSYTHALFSHPFMAIPFAYLAYRLYKKEIPFYKLYLFFVFSFFTHVMMDCCTTYGTQLFLPFTDRLISWNNLSVVDPLFTFPMIIFFLLVWFIKKESFWRRIFAKVSIAISLLYLLSSTVNKFNAADVFKQALKEKNIAYSGFSTTPTMFTSWLWNVVAYNDTSMYLAEWSVFQDSGNIDFVEIKRNTELLKPFENSKAEQTALWFSQGNYFAEPGLNDTVDFYITKWGRGDLTSKDVHKMFPFYAQIYKEKNGTVQFRQVEPNFTERDFRNYFSMLHRRIFYQ
jgi:inner membrane protein